MNHLDQLPPLSTPRLLLRAFTLEDAPAVQALCNDQRIYATSLSIPHPYQLANAEWWIGQHTDNLRKDRQADFALVLHDCQTLVGTVGLKAKRKPECGELGYWVGAPYWGKGYATEASRAVLRFGFEIWDLPYIYARHFAENIASGRVLQKIGMVYESLTIGKFCKDGRKIDSCQYGLRREHFCQAESDALAQ